MSLEDAKTQIDHAFTGSVLKGHSFENTFSGAPSFLRRRYTKDLSIAQLAYTGIPFDQAVTNRPGTRLGPRAVREASLLQPYDKPYGWDFDVLEDFALADYGDMAFDYGNVANVPDAIEAHITSILDQDCAAITLGGDHFITLPILRAHVRKHGPLALVQIDAHTDTWADDTPGRIDHGTFLYKAVKEGLVLPECSVQIGIRTDNPDTMGFHIIDAPEVHRTGAAEVARRTLEITAGCKSYVTFDIDGLDPAFAPGTGTPVSGGLASWQALDLLRALSGLDVVGADVVEVSPPFDHAGITAVAAAHMVTELTCLWAATRR